MNLGFKKINIFLKDFSIILLIFIISYFIVFIPNISSIGALNGLNFCAEILIPSLFPFMVISSFLVYCGLATKLGNLIKSIVEFLFFLPGGASIAIIFGLIGGYPTGAKIIKDLHDKKIINENQANRMLIFCTNAGPSFVVSIVGISFIKNKNIGILILISQIIASILIGIILGFISKLKKETDLNNIVHKKNNEYDFSNSLVKACESTSKTIINMCAMVIILSVIISFIKYFNIHNKILLLFLSFNIIKISDNSILALYEKLIFAGLTSFLEITQGCAYASKMLISPVILSAGISWGGICVHLQIKSIFGKLKLLYHKFIFYRLIHAIISSSLTYILLKYFKIPEFVFYNQDDINKISTVTGISSNIFGSTSLIFTCIYFLINSDQCTEK